MTRKIFHSGNSAVVSLPRDLLDRLGLEVGSEVEVSADPEGRRILIKPADEELAGVDEDFGRRVERFVRRYRPALRELAHR